MASDTWLLIFLSIALGLLVGLQRQSVNSKTAGIRTFPLITLAGTFCGLLAKDFGPWLPAAGLIAVTALLVIGNVSQLKSGEKDMGLTTEMAVIIMYIIGIYLVIGEKSVAVVVTGIVTVLLHFKSTLHGWVDKIGEKDLVAIMQFVLISMVILPILPNQTYDLYNSLNPRETWLMVVLIVGISLAGYFVYKLWGDKAGVLLGGILGGVISSTATTLSYAKKAAQSATAAKLAAFVILTASAVSMIRVMAEIAVITPSGFRHFAFPLGAELLVMILLVAGLFFQHRKEKNRMPEQGNPAQLKSAIVFALLYALIRFVSEAVKKEFGEEALYIVSFVSGLTDLDAITLSTARMTAKNEIEPSLGWRLILLAVMSNLLFKGIMAYLWGGRYLGKLVAILFGILIAVGVAIFFLWPS